ncbi:MAG: ABC transporter permease, partial [Clostridia bacterium]|nr:ABC transporter permease [Clostridia bacterium]
MRFLKIKIKREYILSIIAVILGLIAGALLMIVTGNNPFSGFSYLFRGGLMSIERIGNTIAAS